MESDEIGTRIFKLGRLIDGSFLTLMQHWSGAVVCPAC
jgi:hypothetical protein